MSYARFAEGGSDLYLIGTLRNGVEEVFYCCGCILNEKEWVEDEGSFLGGFLRALSGEPDFMSPSRSETFDHLGDHIGAGHMVPLSCLNGIADENEWGTP